MNAKRGCKKYRYEIDEVWPPEMGITRTDTEFSCWAANLALAILHVANYFLALTDTSRLTAMG